MTQYDADRAHAAWLEREEAYRDRGDETDVPANATGEDRPRYRFAVVFDGTELERFDTPQEAADHTDYLYNREPRYATYREAGHPLLVEEVTEYPNEGKDGLPC